jgi:DNA replication protein DnaC
VTQWGAVSPDDVLAAAILDRPLPHSHTIPISGDTDRLEQKREAGFFGSTTQQTRA